MERPTSPAEFKQLVESSRTERTRVRALVNEGKWRLAEPDRTRAIAYDTAHAPPGPEALVGATDDLQQVVFLFEGARVRRAVGFVEVSGARSSSAGTGFLISPRLLLTNQHVIENADAARAGQVTFDREMLADGRPSAATTYLLAPDDFALFSAADQLDYAIVAVGARNSGSALLDELGHCILADSPDRHRIGMNVNIIQHPDGLPKMIAIRNNILTYRTDRTLLYETDTDHGSSGSPVFNDAWELVALHHWGSPYLEPTDEKGTAFPTNVNEGVRISAIYADLAAKAATLPSAQRLLLEEALSYAHRPAASGGGPELSPPRPDVAGSSAGEALSTTAFSQTKDADMSGDNTIRFTIPIEIVARVAGPAAAVVPVAVAAPEARTLTRGAEVLTVDEDYSTRGGYDDAFITGSRIAMPVPNATLAKQIAPLRAGEANAAAGILKYEHFSVVMNKSKRMALFTATNIDGNTYLNVDRGTGQVAAGSEGDKWFKDPRISESFWTGQDFYSEWSTYFDRGHLTRRSDPTWGTADEPERANADTFHWTNCSPQHFRFNEATPYWQGAERYVLENGVLAQKDRKPIVVLQGPIFDAAIDHYAGDLQIPSSFFKVIVWPVAAGLKSVGLVVDQLSLLSEKRLALGQPHDVKSVNVSHWRVSIKTIEQRTGLDFGAAVKGADTIESVAQPNVGGEMAIAVRSLADILR